MTTIRIEEGEVMPEKILIVEDEKAIQMILKTYLENAGYDVELANDGLEGISKFQRGTYDLVLLDVMIPKIDGYVVLEMIRNESNTPVMMLTALEKDQDQMKAFDLQADDYIIKPFKMGIVLRRIEAVLRRRLTIKDADLNRELLTYGDLSVDLKRCEVFVSGELIPLTKKEFELLALLLEKQDQVFSREMILEKLWGYDFYGNSKVVNTHVQHLRRKLGGDYIEAVRGIGYKFSKKNEQ